MAIIPIPDLQALLKDIPPGAWVAISKDRDRVVAFGAEMREVLEEAARRGEREPLIYRVPEHQEALIL